ncbi:MAG: CRISPR-associated helicase Cas3' [Firmicutes bacterium]|nr:CRISPR-associated helicase Cas3' [Bacillota bacterium]
MYTYTPHEVKAPDNVNKVFDTAFARPNQLLSQHLYNVSSLAAHFGKKCGIGEIMRLAGFLHDLGKISEEFQAKLSGSNNQVPHSIFGAKRIYEDTKEIRFVPEILANAITAHHGKLYDNLSPEGDIPLLCMLADVPLFPCAPNSPPVDLSQLSVEFDAVVRKVHSEDVPFTFSMLAKLVYSCLVDVDRLDAYRHENNIEDTPQADWDNMLANLTNHLAKFATDSEIALFRKKISDGCNEAGLRDRGVYKLEVPTGGGKTLASLRFALTHAKKHKLDRIIFVIPYLSILSQTADVIRKALKADEATVLEHHSGFLSDEKKEIPQYYNLQTDRWDAPIILTTQVQFLESVFSAKGSDLRKLHNMANSVIIFDEAQSLPVKCVHLFNGAINFLNRVCETTVLLCTATQPLLNNVCRPLRFSENPAIVECGELSKRTKIINTIKQSGYTYSELAAFVMDKHKLSTLVIVNTKAAAKSLYEELKATGVLVLHLSTNMCAAHRDGVIAELHRMLEAKEPVICISTQLIEAGVDISLECVIRDVAGLDSIFQAAGRCNRHGEFGKVQDVFVVNIAGENLDKLPDIKKGAEITKRLFDEGRGDDINAYYEYYFYVRRRIMDYPTSDDGNIYDLLATNVQGRIAYKNRRSKMGVPNMLSAIRSASDAFYVIDRGRTDVVVPYGDALQLVKQYCDSYCPSEKRKLMRLLGKYSVSLYKYQIDDLRKSNALYPQEELTVLANGFYDKVRGVDLDGQHDFLFL